MIKTNNEKKNLSLKDFTLLHGNWMAWQLCCMATEWQQGLFFRANWDEIMYQGLLLGAKCTDEYHR